MRNGNEMTAIYQTEPMNGIRALWCVFVCVCLCNGNEAHMAAHKIGTTHKNPLAGESQ